MKDKIGGLVTGHVLVLIGLFIVTRGFYVLVKGSASFGEVFGSPLFWGGILLLLGFCTIRGTFNTYLFPVKGKQETKDGKGSA
jgi:hypothetical protein